MTSREPRSQDAAAVTAALKSELQPLKAAAVTVLRRLLTRHGGNLTAVARELGTGPKVVREALRRAPELERLRAELAPTQTRKGFGSSQRSSS